MQFSFTEQRGEHARRSKTYGWLTALALASVAVAGCSSSGASGPDAAKASPTPSTATGAAPGRSSAAPAPAGARPADACTLLTSDQVAAALGTSGPFNGAPLGLTSTVGKVWGCTWGTAKSVVSLQELDAKTFADSKGNAKPTTVSGVGDEAFIDSRATGGQPALYFGVAGHFYRLDVESDRKAASAAANAAKDAAKDAAIEEALAKVLARSIKG
ncbi:DUF3558 family protein [Kitasatospora sp. NPDC048365]|uniref:DUF3558 family protein n=1 Tax=Kitasatospora sp. NPDC048365 TaxID=3364050 RepID=UPI0037101B72